LKYVFSLQYLFIFLTQYCVQKYHVGLKIAISRLCMCFLCFTDGVYQGFEQV